MFERGIGASDYYTKKKIKLVYSQAKKITNTIMITINRTKRGLNAACLSRSARCA